MRKFYLIIVCTDSEYDEARERGVSLLLHQIRVNGVGGEECWFSKSLKFDLSLTDTKIQINTFLEHQI